MDVQVDLLRDLQRRVVVPMTQATAPESFPLTYLTPTIDFDGESYVQMTPQLAGVSRAELGPHAGSVTNQG